MDGCPRLRSPSTACGSPTVITRRSAGSASRSPEGEVFGLLGPNGAGKTTTIEILEGYRPRDAGEVDVLGFDPGRAGPAFRERIGVVLQQSQLWPTITVAETHRMFAGYYDRPRDVDEVIKLVGLEEKRDARVKTLSGGQKRRLDLGVALVGDPDLVFLDEPTTGFDPAARRAAWDMIRALRSLGKTILLTTHYLDEAEQLADRVAVLREGQIIREGTPAELTGGDERDRGALPPGRARGRDPHDRTDPPLAGTDRGSACRRPRGRRTSGSPAHARGRVSLADRARGTMRLYRHQLRWEQLLFWRSRESAVFVFLFPLLLFTLLTSVYNGRIYGRPASWALLAGMLGYGAATTAFAGLALILVARRELGILKRIRSTPLPPATYLVAVLTSIMLVFALQAVSLFVARQGAEVDAVAA